MHSAIMTGLGVLADRASARAVIEAPAGKPGEAPDESDLVTLFLTGDVMTGRGIDQVLLHPGDPRLYEPYMKSALGYVALAEDTNGPIPRPVDFSYIWGDALGELDVRQPDVRLINLEAAVTSSGVPEPKGINYRMHPANAPVLTAAGVDCCSLANNHVLDWGVPGLLETIKTLGDLGVTFAGAGRNLREAGAPAILPVGHKGRVMVFSFGSPSSGIPRSWAAAKGRPGVNFLPDLSRDSVQRIAREVLSVKGSSDVVVASIHWGSNWGYEIPEQQISFSHALIDEAGMDVVHGHSSHHFKGIEIYRDRPILYGCGDFLNDYEGISGYEEYRGDLALMYFLTLHAALGTLARLEIAPLQIRNFRLNRVSQSDAEWIWRTLNREGRRFGTSVRLGADNALTVEWD